MVPLPLSIPIPTSASDHLLGVIFGMSSFPSFPLQSFDRLDGFGVFAVWFFASAEMCAGSLLVPENLGNLWEHQEGHMMVRKRIFIGGCAILGSQFESVFGTEEGESCFSRFVSVSFFVPTFEPQFTPVGFLETRFPVGRYCNNYFFRRSRHFTI